MAWDRRARLWAMQDISGAAVHVRDTIPPVLALPALISRSGQFSAAPQSMTELSRLCIQPTLTANPAGST